MELNKGLSEAHQRGLGNEAYSFGSYNLRNVLEVLTHLRKMGLGIGYQFLNYLNISYLLFCLTRLISIGNERVRQAITKQGF